MGTTGSMVQLIFVVAALICAIIAAFFYVQPTAAPRRPHFGWLAIALWMASILAGFIPKS